LLLVFHPPTYTTERCYIFEVLLNEFLGLEYQTIIEERCDVSIKLRDDPCSMELILSELLFQTPKDEWLTPPSLPKQPLELWDVSKSPIDAITVGSELPVIYGNKLPNGTYLQVLQTGITLGVDIFGSAFFMLTRYEEVIKSAKDNRERFPAKASLAYQEGFLTRPIVNEYIEILWWALKYLWPGLRRKQRLFQVHLSHDVDWPLCIAGRTWPQVFKIVLGDLVKRKNHLLAVQRFQSFMLVTSGNIDSDICNTFDFIMNLSEKQGLRSAFYFITDHSAGEVDGIYSMADPWIRKLLRRIHERNHEIGLHPSYHTLHDPSRLLREFQILLQVCEAEGIHQEIWGGRQHYLRWKAPITWQSWENAGLNYDSTLTFADYAGFRCGVCYEYRVFNLKDRRSLNLWERPLIIMESTVLGEYYMNLSYNQALEEIIRLKERCKMFKGNFTLLWHNSRLIDNREAELYRSIVEGL